MAASADADLELARALQASLDLTDDAEIARALQEEEDAIGAGAAESNARAFDFLLEELAAEDARRFAAEEARLAEQAARDRAAEAVFRAEGAHALYCPNCGAKIVIKRGEENCRVFICGVHRDTGRQLPPHDEAGAAALVVQGKVVLGCGKQMRLVDGALVPCTGC